ncbi:hypothetical protein GKZ90_0004255 [Flavobacterium sp. MC2016-06]|jgi:hypothetical protein|uniref:hypothetical protein n=1 Tax=Flavobacterium sp. MC2016-06 TaxID=2676308 RepID=UPI0012BA5BDC|nr:hypothetical protein [Flavobacterium sp. MC2016-06]MBU3858797.1 hypothetical protein [Flavobacterium sp. MC2016-06]
MKKTILALIIFTIILLVLFFWQETQNLSLDRKIDDEKLANFFTSFGGIIVLISLYYLYKQFIEMKSGYLPDLYLSSVKFKVDIKPGMEFIDDKPILKISQMEDNKSLDINAYFQLHNIGLGACKNISIDWIYDLDSVKEIFQNKFQHFPIFIAESQHLDFLQANGKIQIDIPEFYFFCCAPEFNINPTNHQEFAEKLMRGIPLKPKLECEIKYYNIQNELYTKKFNVEIMPIEDILKIKFLAA